MKRRRGEASHLISGLIQYQPLLENWKRNIQATGENPSIGIIICKSKDKTYVEYALKRSNVPIRVAIY